MANRGVLKNRIIELESMASARNVATLQAEIDRLTGELAAAKDAASKLNEDMAIAAESNLELTQENDRLHNTVAIAAESIRTIPIGIASRMEALPITGAIPLAQFIRGEIDQDALLAAFTAIRASSQSK